MQPKNSETRDNPFSIRTYKTLFFNALLLNVFLRLFAISPNSIKNLQHVNERSNFGTMAA